MLEGTGTGRGHVHRIKCPRLCGWHREFTKTDEWLHTIITHPLYGEVSNEMAAQLDILSHDCIETANARLRMKYRRAQWDNTTVSPLTTL